jgi:hypothetical protein
VYNGQKTTVQQQGGSKLMPVFTVHKGRRYRATITLGLFQSFASNETVAGKVREVGFTEVEVSGSGRNRLGKGLWPHADASAEIPPEITKVTEIEV